MHTAKDIMTTPVISISEDKTLQDAVELMAQHHFSGLPVTDSDNRIVGIISDTDIIRYAHEVSVVPLSSLSGWVSPHSDISDLASIRKGMENLHRTTVKKIMVKKVYTVNEDDPVNEIARLMNRRNINRVPVVDNQGMLVGIVTRADMVRCMAKIQEV